MSNANKFLLDERSQSFEREHLSNVFVHLCNFKMAAFHISVKDDFFYRLIQPSKQHLLMNSQ